jgi:hypothetical protein
LAPGPSQLPYGGQLTLESLSKLCLGQVSEAVLRAHTRSLPESPATWPGLPRQFRAGSSPNLFHGPRWKRRILLHDIGAPCAQVVDHAPSEHVRRRLSTSLSNPRWCAPANSLMPALSPDHVCSAGQTHMSSSRRTVDWPAIPAHDDALRVAGLASVMRRPGLPLFASPGGLFGGQRCAP